MNRLAAGVVMLAIALGSSPGEGKLRRTEALGKKVCNRICMQMMVDCTGLVPGETILAEVALCTNECIFESKDPERHPRWLCASRAESCDALKACNPEGKT